MELVKDIREFSQTSLISFDDKVENRITVDVVNLSDFYLIKLLLETQSGFSSVEFLPLSRTDLLKLALYLRINASAKNPNKHNIAELYEVQIATESLDSIKITFKLEEEIAFLLDRDSVTEIYLSPKGVQTLCRELKSIFSIKNQNVESIAA